MTDEEKRSDEAEEAKKSDESETEGSASEEAKLEETKSEETKSEGGDVNEKAEPEASATGELEAKESADETEEAASEAAVSEEAAPEEPNIAAATDHGYNDHGHDDHGHDEHLGHTAPVSLLVGVLVALGMLTILTVAVTAVDLGSQGNFVVAMIIATVKAILVMGYFMHMFWDAKFNVVAFTSSFLFVLLFLAMTVLDGSEYQDVVHKYENDKKAQM